MRFVVNDLAWTCHICGELRLDKFISVRKIKHTMYVENVRYCNDRSECCNKVLNYRRRNARLMEPSDAIDAVQTVKEASQ